MSRLHYWVPWGRDNIPNWSRAVPETHLPPKLRARHPSLLLTEPVLDHGRGKGRPSRKKT